jgi:long-chain acyl-CoA synthetase
MCRHVSSKILNISLRLIISEGAPLSVEVEELLRVTSCAFVVTGYGWTETCGPTTLGFPDEMCMIGTVGPVGVYNELCLEEVLEFFLGDKEDVRGEE